MSIINVFHDNEINVNHAQLIFDIHNPIFLNSNLLRRDEIKFVERSEVSDVSDLYALSDFKTSGSSGVRKNEDYMKNYFISRYGDIEDIIFHQYLKKLFLKKVKSDMVRKYTKKYYFSVEGEKNVNYK